MSAARLELTRAEILGFRRSSSHLDARLPPGSASIREAARAGLSDSMPRGALLSLHARVAGVGPNAWDEPPLVQTWSLRYSAYAVAADDLAVFTLGRLPTDERRRRRATETADRLEAFLGGRRMSASEAGRGMGVNANSLRYGSPTGRILIRWDGARQPTIWMQPPPAIEATDARLELARRYLHVLGPGTPGGFGDWAGIRAPTPQATFDALADEITAVRTPIGEAWILASDEEALRAAGAPPGTPRLLPSGDTFFLLQGVDRELLVPDAGQRSRLWTSRVWPGCLLMAGEPAGTWRRSNAVVSIEPWRALTDDERHAVELEAATLPLPGLEGRVIVRWSA
jgi:Winged helix DNA-binding domain